MSKKIYGVTVGTPMSPAAIAEKLKPVKTVNGVAPDENGNVNVDGVSAEEKELILSLFQKAAYTADMSATFAQLAELWGIEVPDEPVVPDEPDIPDEPEEPDVPVVTLTSISATYSGGDVPVGTAVTDLTGIVVTAHYSDGTSKAVTDYTLSGTIAEGANTITVSYGGKSTTFAVTGVAEEEPDVPDVPAVTPLYNWDFTRGLTDSVKSQTATLSTASYTNAITATMPYQDSTGLHFDGKGQCCDLGEVFATNRTYEFDVAEFDFQGVTTQHVRFIMTGGNSVDYSEGPLVYRKGTGWSAYSKNTKAWNASVYSGLSGASADVLNYFSGKTVKIYIDDSGYATLYVDGANLGTTVDIFGTDGTHMNIGNIGYPTNTAQDPAAVGAQLYNVTITGARVYNGFKE